MPKQTSSVDTRQFNQMCRQLAREVNLPLPTILKSEVGKVLEGALRYTRAASVSKILSRYQEFVPLGQDAYSPRRIRTTGNLRGPNLIYYMQNRYPKELWARLRARRTQLIKRARAARGLAKQSWLQIARMLGITINAPGYVASAVPSTGAEYNNATVSQSSDTKGAKITIGNAQPTVNAIGGAQALQRAIEGRYKFFYRNMEKGVFNSMAKVAKAYPGLKIKA